MTSPLDTENMAALEASISSLRSLGGEEITLVLGELDRLRGKVEEITDGKTTLILSDADRATRVQDLDDASLAAWARWVFLNMERVRERMQDKDFEADGDAMTLGAMQGVIGLALMTFMANNSHVSFTSEGVTFGEKSLGDWQVDVRQIKKASGELVRDKNAVIAEVHSDDHRAKAEFDIRPILLQADHGWLLDLARCDWGGDQPADELALKAESYDDNVIRFFEYIRTAETGFECSTDGDHALTWLRDHRPDAWENLVADLEKEGKY